MDPPGLTPKDKHSGRLDKPASPRRRPRQPKPHSNNAAEQIEPHPEARKPAAVTSAHELHPPSVLSHGDPLLSRHLESAETEVAHISASHERGLPSFKDQVFEQDPPGTAPASRYSKNTGLPNFKNVQSVAEDTQSAGACIDKQRKAESEAISSTTREKVGHPSTGKKKKEDSPIGPRNNSEFPDFKDQVRSVRECEIGAVAFSPAAAAATKDRNSSPGSKGPVLDRDDRANSIVAQQGVAARNTSPYLAHLPDFKDQVRSSSVDDARRFNKHLRFNTDGAAAEQEEVPPDDEVEETRPNNSEPDELGEPIRAEMVSERTLVHAVAIKPYKNWIIAVVVSVIFAVIVVILVLVLGNEKNDGTAELTPAPSTTMRPTETATPTFAPTRPSLTAVPTSQPSPCPSQNPLCFETRDELRAAVDVYLGLTAQEQAQSPIGSWDVSRVTDFSRLFDAVRARRLSNFDQDISAWNMSQAVDTSRMFRGFYDTHPHNFNGNVSEWDVSRVEKMDWMFFYATRFDQDLSRWQTDKVTTMSLMFCRASSFKGNVSSWQTGSVTDMSNIFAYASSFNGDISSWQTDSVAHMDQMFCYASSFDSDISPWDVSKVPYMYSMFEGASSFNRDISSWTPSSLEDMDSMFLDASSFDQNLCAWGPHIPSTAFVFAAFEGTSCPLTASPNLTGTPPGPFCHTCTL